MNSISEAAGIPPTPSQAELLSRLQPTSPTPLRQRLDSWAVTSGRLRDEFRAAYDGADPYESLMRRKFNTGDWWPEDWPEDLRSAVADYCKTRVGGAYFQHPSEHEGRCQPDGVGVCSQCRDIALENWKEFGALFRPAPGPSGDVQEAPGRPADDDDYADVDFFGDWDDVAEQLPPDTLHAGLTALVRSGEFGGIYADSLVGKSWLCAVWAYQEAISGHHTVWVDYEYQRCELLKRLRLLGLSTDELRRVHHIDGNDFTSADLVEVTSRIRKWRRAGQRVTVIIDAFTGFHDAHDGGDQNQTHTVEATHSAARRLFQSAGATVCFLDHENSSGGLNGNPRKVGGLDYLFRLRTVTRFAEGVPGKAELIVVKARDGRFVVGRKVAELVCDGTTFTIEDVDQSPADRARELALGQMVRKLGRAPGTSDRDLRNAVDSKYRHQVTPELIAEARV